MEKLHDDTLINEWLLAGYNLEEATRLTEISRKYKDTVSTDLGEFNKCLITAVNGFKQDEI